MQHAPGFLCLVRDAKTRIRECAIADVKAKLDRGVRKDDTLPAPADPPRGAALKLAGKAVDVPGGGLRRRDRLPRARVLHVETTPSGGRCVVSGP
jgi:hypothetical protein